MTAPFHIAPVRTPADLTASIALFRAYAESLGFSLCFQNFDAEMAAMPGKYAPHAGGELLLARDATTGDPVGCVALRALDDGCCEMKRLYVAPGGRGCGLGRALVAAVVQAARGLGYGEMRLDSLGSMEAALAIYRSFGFREIEAYYQTPLEDTHFLGLRL